MCKKEVLLESITEKFQNQVFNNHEIKKLILNVKNNKTIQNNELDKEKFHELAINISEYKYIENCINKVEKKYHDIKISKIKQEINENI